MRLLLLFLVGSAGLFASTVATANCTLGLISQNVTSSTRALCGIPDETADSPVTAGAMAGSLNVSVYAYILPGTSQPASSYAYAADTEYFRTAGPVRAGIIEYYLTGGGECGATSAASISNGSDQYSLFCNTPSCNTAGPPPQLPFELGTTFEMLLTATAPGGVDRCADAQAGVGFFQLFEEDGTTEVSLIPVAVPEPGKETLLLTALPLAFWISKRRP